MENSVFCNEMHLCACKPIVLLLCRNYVPIITCFHLHGTGMAVGVKWASSIIGLCPLMAVANKNHSTVICAHSVIV